ncbi:MAG: hypothetical protein AAFO91_10385, partial [Bacteroidota bacterium]
LDPLEFAPDVPSLRLRRAKTNKIDPYTSSRVTKKEVLDVLDVDLGCLVFEVQSVVIDFFSEVWESETKTRRVKRSRTTFGVQPKVVDHLPDLLGQVQLISSSTFGNLGY